MKEKGYTLLELLVAVLLIGLVLMLYMASWSKAQSKARDGRRKADLGIIKLALETYFTDNNVYPAASLINFGAPFTYNGEIYMKMIPNDPRFPDNKYCYAVATNFLSYTLGADFETEARGCTALPVVTPAPTAATPTTVPTPTLTPVSTPTPTLSPTPTPFGCSPCSGLGASYCCNSQIYSESMCSTASLGTFPCGGSCTNIWRQIEPDGSCAPDVSSPGQRVGESCLVCGETTNCLYDDIGCGTLSRFTTCICW